MKNILIVEDERIVGIDIRDSLESLGYKVLDIVTSGEEAIRKAEKLRPEIVMMDIGLKGEVDGIGAAKKIREMLNVAIIFLTAYEDESTMEQANDLDPADYIIKPFGEEQLKISIEKAVAWKPKLVSSEG